MIRSKIQNKTKIPLFDNLYHLLTKIVLKGKFKRYKGMNRNRVIAKKYEVRKEKEKCIDKVLKRA